MSVESFVELAMASGLPPPKPNSAPDKALEESALHLIRTERWASTWHIGCYLRKQGWVFPTRDLRNVLKKLEASGVVRRHVYSTSNNLFWELVPTEGAKP